MCYIVQLITPKVPAMAVSTVISSLMISFQLIFIAVIYNLLFTIYLQFGYLTIGLPDGSESGATRKDSLDSYDSCSKEKFSSGWQSS